jgi:hypothetical protein
MKKTELEQEEKAAKQPTSKKEQLEELSQRQIELEQDVERDKFRVEEMQGHINVVRAHCKGLSMLCRQLMIITHCLDQSWSQKTMLENATKAKSLENELMECIVPYTLGEELRKRKERLVKSRKQLREVRQQIVELIETKGGAKK